MANLTNVKYVKRERVALIGRMNFHEIELAPPLSSPAPVKEIKNDVPDYKPLAPIVLTDDEKAQIIQECIVAGYTIGATVIRPHHANGPQEHLQHLVGTIIGFDRMNPKMGQYAPLLVRWGRPNKGVGMAYNYRKNELDLFHYTWEKE